MTSALVEVDRNALRRRCANFFGEESLWPVLEAAYNEPHRTYHTLEHLQELFAALAPVEALELNWAAIEFAVWFHDFIYEVHPSKYGDNEQRSADELIQRVTPLLSGNQDIEFMTKQLVLGKTFILATKYHRLELADCGGDSSALAAGHLFLDADLSILAAPRERLERYDSAIAHEWGQDPGAPSMEFCRGRAAALEGLAAREPLFYTARFKPLEAPARHNLAHLATRWRRHLPG